MLSSTQTCSWESRSRGKKVFAASLERFYAVQNVADTLDFSRVLGPEGKCQALDSRAAGYGRGEGVASVVLKRLDAALRDGDPIHSVIRQTAINQDGRTATITSPSVDAQERLIRECYDRAGLDLADTAFVEGHFTGK